jgi:hypothetical protein
MISEAKEGSAGSIRKSGFFCMSGSFLVLNSGRSIRGPLETYAGWIIRENTDSDLQFHFSPVINTANTIPLGDIKSIKFSDTFLNPETYVSKASMKLSKLLLDTLLGNVTTLQNMNIDDIVSAELVLKINKKLLKKSNANALKTALRLVDSDNIIITGSNGKRITGTTYLSSVTRDFEKTGSDRFNERAIETAMREILRAVKSGEVVS